MSSRGEAERLRPERADAMERAVRRAGERALTPSISAWYGDGRPRLSAAGGIAPFEHRAADLAIQFDGILDNDAELASACGLPHDAPASAIVAAAYARWDVESVPRLLGDFAFAIADRRRRRLVCARDVFGQRPLYYSAVADGVRAASSMADLLRDADVDASPNEGIVAELLTGFPATIEETVWRGVRRLRPAHVLIADARGIRTFRYWDFDPEAHAADVRPDECAERFRELFQQAVACRLRHARRAAIFLSGGIDSSAIAVVAARLRPGDVRAFSVAFPGDDCDETPYVDAVVAASGLPLDRRPSTPPSYADIVRPIERWADVPPDPTGFDLDPLRRRARESEMDVVLTGYGGDEWFTGSPSHTADLLRRGRVLAAVRQWAHDRALPGRNLTGRQLARTAIVPLLPSAVRRILRPLAGSPRPRYEWIAASFAEAVNLQERSRLRPTPALPTFAQRDMYRIATGAVQALGDEQEHRAACAFGITQRYPFYDRRLAEFGLALPESQRWAGGETKVVIRRALDADLPRVVRTRNDKAEFSSTYVHALEAVGARDVLARLRCEEAGWVDGDAIRRAHDDMRRLYNERDRAYRGLAGAVWSVIAVELWLRHGAACRVRRRVM